MQLLQFNCGKDRAFIAEPKLLQLKILLCSLYNVSHFLTITQFHFF